MKTNAEKDTKNNSNSLFSQGQQAFFSPKSPFFSPTIQTKLEVGSPNDKYEQEADAVADSIMRKVENPFVSYSSPIIQRKCAACEEEEKIQRKEDETHEEIGKIQSNAGVSGDENNTLQRKCAECGKEEKVQRKPLNITPIIQKSSFDGGGVANDAISSQIAASKGGGNPMGESTKNFMENRFGNDFSGVRIHTDSNAIQLSQNLDAQAFTVGNDVFFNQGKYSPDSDSGKHLLAHELTHTVQQSGTIQRENEESNTAISTQARFIVDDSETPQEGQMQKSIFLTRLNNEVCETVNQAMQGTPYTSENCPYLRAIFARHENSSPVYLEQTMERYQPSIRFAQSAGDYIEQIRIRVFGAATRWLETKNIAEVLQEEAIDIPNPSEGNIEQSLENPTSQEESSTDAISFKAKEGGAEASATQSPQSVMQSLGKGNAIDSNARSRMEGAFGMNFSDVEVHTDSQAASLASGMNARAFAVGNHVAFGSGEYKPGTLIGDALMAHELAHVVQQSGGNELNQKGESANTSLEEDADISATGAVMSMWGGLKGSLKDIGKNAMPRMRSGLKLQRCPAAGGAALVVALETTEIAAVVVVAEGTTATLVTGAAVTEGVILTAPAAIAITEGVVLAPVAAAAVPAAVSIPAAAVVSAPTVAEVAVAATAIASTTIISSDSPAPTTPQRRNPNQTCEDSVLDVLQASKDAICNSIPSVPNWSPSRSLKMLDRIKCSEILTRIQAFEACLRIRQQIQDDCFGGIPDPSHTIAIEELQRGLLNGRARLAINCAPGHPMANQ